MKLLNITIILTGFFLFGGLFASCEYYTANRGGGDQIVGNDPDADPEVLGEDDVPSDDPLEGIAFISGDSVTTPTGRPQQSLTFTTECCNVFMSFDQVVRSGRYQSASGETVWVNILPPDDIVSNMEE